MAGPDEPMGILELDSLFQKLGNVPDSVLSEALQEMAQVACDKIRSQGESMNVRDPESDEHILDKIRPSGKPRITENGGWQTISFFGSRTRGQNRTKVRNAEIAFVNEYGKRGQPARSFIRTALSRYETAICAPGIRILNDWFENQS